MDKLLVITCEDGSCCCVPSRTSIILISLLGFAASIIDIMVSESNNCCPLKEYVESMRTVLIAMFQLANLLLLLASIIENALLVTIYVCYTLGFVVMGLCLSIVELLYRTKHEGVNGIVCFVPEVIFIFVISRCLPLVNDYKKNLERLQTQ